MVKSNHTNIVSNGYFLDHPERIIHTDAKRDTDPYGKPAMVYTHSGGVEGIATDLYQMLSADLSARLDLERYNGIKEKRQETRQTIVVQPMQTEAKKEEKSVQLKAEPVQAVAQEVESKRPEAPVMDLYDLFGYTQEERRLAERGLKPERRKAVSPKGRKPYSQHCSPSRRAERRKRRKKKAEK